MTNLSKEEILKQFNWISNTKVDARSNADVTISISNRQKKKADIIHIAIRNEVGRSIVGKKVEFAAYKNRLMFKIGDTGYTASGQHGKSFSYITITLKEGCEVFRDYIGDFPIKYDDFLDVYYIERRPRAYSSDTRKYLISTSNSKSV